MPLNIRSEEVNQLAERLAARRRINKTDAVRQALENELRRLDEVIPLRERLRPLQARVLAPADTQVMVGCTPSFCDDQLTLCFRLSVHGRCHAGYRQSHTVSR